MKILKSITAHLTVFLENKGKFWEYVEFIMIHSTFSNTFQAWLDLDWFEGGNEILNLQTSEIWSLMCGVCFKHLKLFLCNWKIKPTLQPSRIGDRQAVPGIFFFFLSISIHFDHNRIFYFLTVDPVKYIPAFRTSPLSTSPPIISLLRRLWSAVQGFQFVLWTHPTLLSLCPSGDC